MAERTNIPRTPSGRIPGMPLRNPKHERLCHALVQGKTGQEAGAEAGYKDNNWLRAHIYTIRTRPDVQERIAEIAEKATALAEIYDAWLLGDAKLFARASLGHFFRHNPDGSLELDDACVPIIDFAAITEERLRTLKEFSMTKFGPKIVIHDVHGPREQLMRHRGLLRDKVALTNQAGDGPAEMVLTDDTTRARALAAFIAKTRAQGKNEGEAA